MKWIKVAGCLLLVLCSIGGCCGCGEERYEVIAEVDFWSCDYTGKHAVMLGPSTVAVFNSFAEADSVCLELNSRLPDPPEMEGGE